MVDNTMSLGAALVALRLVEAGAPITDAVKRQLLHMGLITYTPESTPPLRVSARGTGLLTKLDGIQVSKNVRSDVSFSFPIDVDSLEAHDPQPGDFVRISMPYRLWVPEDANLKLGTPYEPKPKDWKVSDTEMANKVMLLLGRAGEPSKEPGADRIRDKLAIMLREYADSEILGAHKFALELQGGDDPVVPVGRSLLEAAIKELRLAVEHMDRDDQIVLNLEAGLRHHDEGPQ